MHRKGRVSEFKVKYRPISHPFLCYREFRRPTNIISILTTVVLLGAIRFYSSLVHIPNVAETPVRIVFVNLTFHANRIKQVKSEGCRHKFLRVMIFKCPNGQQDTQSIAMVETLPPLVSWHRCSVSRLSSLWEKEKQKIRKVKYVLFLICIVYYHMAVPR